MVKVIAKNCPQNHSCPLVGVCPMGAIKQTGFNAPTIDSTKCVNCLICVNKCAYRAFVE